MFDLDTQEEISFKETPASGSLKIQVGVWCARGLLRWPDLLRMAAFLGVVLNPVKKEKADMNPLLACWMLMHFSGWPAAQCRTGLRDGYVYEMQQQAQLLSTYFTYDDQSLILYQLQKLQKSTH